MKCALCQADNKDQAQVCRKCGANLQVEPIWHPTWKWHLKALSVIFVTLIAAYFAISQFLSRVPKPYRMRDVPKDITPWLK